MKQLNRFAVFAVVLGLAASLSQGAEKKHKKPDATLSISGGAAALGLGFNWGGGTLTYKGKTYNVKVKGLSLGKLGVSSVTAAGEVYNLKKIEDFDGNYTSAGAGMTLAGGRSAIAMKNQHGVRVVLGATTKGVDLTVGGAGVEMKVKK